MQVLGGIKGIANDELQLERYFLIDPVMNSKIEDFCSSFNIEDINTKRDEHPELTSSKNKRITENVKKIDCVFEMHSTNFDDSECLYNTITQKVLDPKLADQFLSHKW